MYIQLTQQMLDDGVVTVALSEQMSEEIEIMLGLRERPEPIPRDIENEPFFSTEFDGKPFIAYRDMDDMNMEATGVRVCGSTINYSRLELCGLIDKLVNALAESDARLDYELNSCG